MTSLPTRLRCPNRHGALINQLHWYFGVVEEIEDRNLSRLLIDDRGHNTDVCHGRVTRLPLDTDSSSGLRDNLPAYINEVSPWFKAYTPRPLGQFTDLQYYRSIGYTHRDESTGGYMYLSCTARGNTNNNRSLSIYIYLYRSDAALTRLYRYWAGNRGFSFPWYSLDQMGFKDGSGEGSWWKYIRSQPSPYDIAGYAGIDLDNWLDYITSWTNTWTSPAAWFNMRLSWRSKELLASSMFIYNEPAFVNDRQLRPTYLDEPMAQLFRHCVDQFPKYADNNISNIKDMVELASSILTGDYGQAFLNGLQSLKNIKGRQFWKTLSKLWLKYRYSISTTAHDTEQALEAMSRKAILYVKPLEFHDTTHFTSPYTGDLIALRLCFDVVQQTNDMLRAFRHGLYQAGLEVNAYTLYDLVPFSFVVDWITGWGDALETAAVGDHYSDYVFTNVCWSLKYTSSKFKGSAQCYTRWYDNVIPLPVGSYHQVSGRTWLKRSADAVALVYH